MVPINHLRSRALAGLMLLPLFSSPLVAAAMDDDPIIKEPAKTGAAKPAAKTTQEKTPSPEWQAKYDAARILLDDEKFEEAIVALKALDKGKNANVKNYLGFAHRKTERWTEAQHYYEEALSLNPKHQGALEYYGRWHIAKNDLASAKALLARLEEACGSKTCAPYKSLAAAITE